MKLIYPENSFRSEITINERLYKLVKSKGFDIAIGALYDDHTAKGDIVIYNLKKRPVISMVIIFCTDSDFKSTINRVEKIISASAVKEAFIYNSTKSQWILIEDGLRYKTSYSIVLKEDLEKLFSSTPNLNAA